MSTELEYDLVPDDEFDAMSIEPKVPHLATPAASPPPVKAEKDSPEPERQHDVPHEELGKYPAKTHARKVAKELGASSGLIYLPGQVEQLYEDSDMGPEFRQRRHFFYMTGCNVPGCAVTYDLKRDCLALWVPYTDAKTILWYGSTPSIEEYKAASDVDYVRYIDGLPQYLCAVLRTDCTLYILHPDQAPDLDCPCSHPYIDRARLRPAIENARVIKTDYEIAMIRRANAVSSAAHRLVLARLRHLTNERDIDALFRGCCLAHGSKRQAYPVIAASGRAASTLHYTDNDQPLAGRQLVVLDAGAEWNCYASDVTRTFPVSRRDVGGRFSFSFSAQAAAVYDLVDRMQRECVARVRPGVPFYVLHLHACLVAVGGLMRLGILRGGAPSEIFAQGTVAAFFPHGLGHHVGLEVHDVSGSRARLLSADGGAGAAPGYAMPSSSWHPAMGGGGGAWTARGKRLRAKRQWVGAGMLREWYREYREALAAVGGAVAGEGEGAKKRQRLEKGMVVTIEPGIYFCRPYIEGYFLEDPAHAKYINKEALEKYWDVGGVRIEDDILVTEDGYENLTTAPKGEEMLEIINQGDEDEAM